MTQPIDPADYREILLKFLQEDIGSGDITTEATVPAHQRAVGYFVAKDSMVLAGIGIALKVFNLLDENSESEMLHHDGDVLKQGDLAARVRGTARELLTGERVATNLLQRLSGIATLTRKFVGAVEGTGSQIVDTRKTTPGLRALEKYAVTVGGGRNHRLDLGDAMLIKENHIRMAGSIREALARARSTPQQGQRLEVEVTDLAELREALEYSPNAILLDNMTPEMVRQAVDLVRAQDGKILVEASGGITLAGVREFAKTGVDWISVGALTHSATAVDISFEIEPVQVN